MLCREKLTFSLFPRDTLLVCFYVIDSLLLFRYIFV